MIPNAFGANLRLHARAATLKRERRSFSTGLGSSVHNQTVNTDNGGQLSPLRLERQPVRPGMRPALAALARCFAITAIIALAIGACRSSTATTAVFVLSPQAGLVMNKDAP